MLLNGKTAIIFGAGGAIGGAVAKAFAREGARLFLSGRSLSKVEASRMRLRRGVKRHRQHRSTRSTRRPWKSMSLPSSAGRAGSTWR